MVELARAGDDEAWAFMLDAMPATLPGRVAVRFRNSEILAIAAWLRTRVPDISDRKIASLLEAAGDAIASRRGLPMLAQGSMLTRGELTVLRNRLEPLVGADRSWPRQRMLRNILAEGVGNSTPLSIARAAV